MTGTIVTGTQKKLLRVLAGEALSPPPLWLMRQAGRYLPEYRALRAEAADFIALCTTPALAAEITLQPLRRFDLDAAILFSDLPLIAWALGQHLEYREGEGPVLAPIRDAAAVAALDPTRVTTALAPVMETVQRVRAEVGEATLIGFAGAPFTAACYMVDGRGGREFVQTRLLAYRDPALFSRLIDILCEATVAYLSAQVAAGAETLMLFDSWAGLLSPGQFSKYVIAPTARIAARLHERHPQVPVIGFPRLAGMLIGDYARRTKVQAVGLDTSADPAMAASLVPTEVALQGNLSPMALVAGGAPMEAETRSIIEALRGRPHIFNLGHGIVPETPPEHVARLVQIVRDTSHG